MASALEGFEDALTRPTNLVVGELESFFAELQKWQRAQNLVSRETLGNFWNRHVRDSLQLLPHLSGLGKNMIDAGSGGGFPALPVAIAQKGSDRRFVLIESNRRKVSFLRAMIRRFELNAIVIDKRIEAVDPDLIGTVDVITSRATASLSDLLDWTTRLRNPDSVALLHKGREFREEVANALKVWQFDVLEIPSVTDPESAILKLSRIRSKDA
ncbi:MAG: 16S rRNA (guanine(527)-N(7))-methyltransferase RsmG [Hyphomicrobiaceae bacterium]|nr:16S rRNA (guanine(527)-N(7))-methyltransferase RsmG [Hyphomicrobiaceae bacterium]MCC0024283.1 16S rRNA (guanine(527)-N(7))-methyltransferase RsmG [Hyphomicrobiaceae bacterium]